MERETFCSDCGMTMAGPCSQSTCPKRKRTEPDRCPYTQCRLPREKGNPCSKPECPLRVYPPIDCDFYYFKPGGKWKYHGEGTFPPSTAGEYHDVTRELIMKVNKGMPGITYDAKDLVVVVVPRPFCDDPAAFPRMLNPLEYPDTERIQVGEHMKKKYPKLGDE